MNSQKTVKSIYETKDNPYLKCNISDDELSYMSIMFLIVTVILLSFFFNMSQVL